ncbi:hypothetical protein AMTRI_Chr01g130720 [Amborella trichopoda]
MLLYRSGFQKKHHFYFLWKPSFLFCGLKKLHSGGKLPNGHSYHMPFKVPSTTLFILDKFEGNSTQVAELVTANGFKAAFALKDGAEGSRGWLNSKLPWSPPNK